MIFKVMRFAAQSRKAWLGGGAGAFVTASVMFWALEIAEFLHAGAGAPTLQEIATVREFGLALGPIITMGITWITPNKENKS